ncbi:MAG: DUF2953 domain-containing protein [Lachnospiraceae bacterium]|nr:DUF2953 domain-containing protein [Lachnospiraceae bacterium]
MIFVTILLTILKITGLVLAGIIGLALLLVLWILLSPIRYKGRIKYSDKPDIKIRASYLCHIVSGYFILDENGQKADFKILWKSMLNGKSKTGTSKHKKKTSKETGGHLIKPEKTANLHDVEEPKPLMITENIPDNAVKKPEDSDDKSPENEAKPKKSIFKKLKDVYNKVRNFIKSMSERVRNALGMRDKIISEIDDADNREAVNYGLTLLKKVLKHILPRRHRIYIRFGTGDPASTGQYLGLMYAFGAWLGLNLAVTPDFDEKVFECDVSFKGHISIAVLLVWAVKAYRNKKFMSFIDKIRNR